MIKETDSATNSAYNNRGKKWKDDERKKLIEMYLNDIDLDIMISHFQRTKYALICELRRIIYQEYMTYPNKETIIKKYRITEDKLNGIIKKYATRYSEQ